jgi:Domain of unknown function (DUF4499)
MSTMTPDASKLLVQEMNEKYPIMVFAMAKQSGDIPSGSKISFCKVTNVTRTDCEISYVTCRGDACAMPKKAIYKFKFPLSDKVYLLKIQSQICAPKFHWLFTKPLALLILIACTLLSVAAMGYGVAGMTEMIDKMPQFESGVTRIFGSAHTFAVAVLIAWILAVMAHFVEAVMAYRFCELVPFANHHSSAWAMLIFLVGWPIFIELKDLMEAKAAHSKQK